MSESIIITDKRILKYFNENPSMDIVTTIHIFIDILQKLSSDLSSTINNATNTEVLSIVKDIKNDISKQNSDMIIKMHDIKKEYMEDMKNALTTNTFTNVEKLSSLLEKNTDTFLSKTQLFINDTIPKSQTIHYTKIDSCLREFHAMISQDTKKLLENVNNDGNTLKEFMTTVDSQFNKMMLSLQQPIFSFISSSEERMNTNLSALKETSITQKVAQDKLSNELFEFLNKYKNNASVKGAVSENMLYTVLQTIFPSDEIMDCRSTTASGDFMVKRLNTSCPTILFENKDYKNSVNTEEVDKFIRDVKLKKCHGILLSQFSPITYKKNFQIDICDGLIHVYIPNVEYNVEKIKTAVDIIDTLSLKLNIIEEEYSPDNLNISRTDIDMIVEEYRKYGVQRIELIDLTKAYSKQITDKIEEMHLPCLRKTLINIGKEENESEFKCCYCNNYTGKNKAGLGAHIRKCKLNPKNSSEVESDNIIINTSKK